MKTHQKRDPILVSKNKFNYQFFQQKKIHRVIFSKKRPSLIDCEIERILTTFIFFVKINELF